MHLIERRLRLVASVSLLAFCTSCGIFGPANPGNGGVGTSTLAVFQDPDSEFSTSDVHDVGNEIVQFDTEAKTIIWAADGRAFQEGLWEIDGNFLRAGAPFQVRFGNFSGERRAYFTETATATICDIEVNSVDLFIFPTSTLVPQ